MKSQAAIEAGASVTAMPKTIDYSRTATIGQEHADSLAPQNNENSLSSGCESQTNLDRQSVAVEQPIYEATLNNISDVSVATTKTVTAVAPAKYKTLESSVVNNPNGTSAEINSKILHKTPPATGSLESQSDVDSALLAGMRDPKEKIALVRLEKALLDFMNSDLPWLEVGGPYNSVILSLSHVNKSRRDSSGTVTLGSATLPNPTLPPNFPEIVPGQRQTSFQKCVLHRLADRFGIVREQGNLIPGSIRLFKRASSKIPIRLLKDLDPVEYLNNSNVYDSRQFYDSNSAYYSKANGTDQQVNSMARTFASSTLAEAKDGVPSVGSNVAINPKKMKIMKRSEKSKTIHADGSATSNGNPKRFNRKNSSELSDKERAYAEARARIFNDENCAELEKNISAASSIDNGFVATGDTSGVDSRTSITLNSALVDDSDQCVGLSNSKPSGNSLQNQDSSSSLLQPQALQAESYAQVSTATQGSQSSSNTATLESKAVYRNRVEEAADPDFRRHRGGGVAIPSTPIYGVGAVSNTSSLHAPAAAVVYGLSHSAGSWQSQSSPSFPVLQHPQQLTQAVPYYPASRQRHPQGQPQYQQIVQHYPYPQSQPMLHSQSFDNISTVSAQSSLPHTMISGISSYQTQNNRELNPRYTGNTSSGGTTVSTGERYPKPRSVTLKAAAPAFYPSRMVSGNPTSSLRVDGGVVDHNNSGAAK